MKKTLVAIMLAGVASSAHAAIAGGSHDLSVNGAFGNTLGSALSSCQYCHAPHRANTAVPGTPLWNRGNAASTSFTMYTSATLTGQRESRPNPNSMTCLSCHDGATDMGATYSSGPGFTQNGAARTMMMTTANGFSATAIIGNDLRADHPVSVQYTPGTSYRAVADATTGTNAVKLYSYNGANYVECASCHDPHTQGASADARHPFLRADKTVLCSRCHLY